MQNQSNENSDSTTKLADKAEQAVAQVKSAAIDRVQSAREQAQSGVDQGRGQVADRIRHVSSALRSAGDNLRNDDEFIARYVSAASERIDSIASYVSSADPKTLMRDVEGLARQRPAWFFGGAFLLGLAAGRFLKSSSTPSDALELSDSDLEDLPRSDYGRDPYRRQAPAFARSYPQEPITPSATIPVTRNPETRSGATAPYPAARTPERAAVPGSISTGSTTPSSSPSSTAGGTAGGAPSASPQPSRPNGIFDAPVSGSSAGPNRS